MSRPRPESTGSTLRPVDTTETTAAAAATATATTTADAAAVADAAGTLDRAQLAELDAASPFARTREWFALPEGLVYLDGNSLGPPPRAALEAVASMIGEEWGRGLVRSWHHAGWWDKPVELGALLGPVLGAAGDEIVVCDSISVNLFKVLTAAARLAERPGLLVEADAFPTDRYLAESVAALLGHEVRYLTHDDELEREFERVGVALLAHVDYRSGRRLDLESVTARAHRAGTLVVWDLAHSAGALALQLDRAAADFAVGCTYKYLNGGPGAPGYVYAARRHLEAVSQPISGWHGHAAPFAFLPEYRPDPGIRRFLAGSPPLVAYAALEASLRLWQGVDLGALELAARSLSSLLQGLLAQRCPSLELVSPPLPSQRGSHLSYRHPEQHRLVEALAGRDVIVDAREPDLVRLSLTPLYLRRVDLFDGVERIAEALGSLGD